MKNLTAILLICFGLHICLSQEKKKTPNVLLNFTQDTKFKLPNGELISYKKYDLLAVKGEYSIDMEKIQNDENHEIYPLIKNSEERKNDIVKWNKKRSDKTGGTIFKNNKGKPISIYEFKTLASTEKWIAGSKRDKETGKFFMQLRKPNERDKQRKIHDQWRKTIIGTPAPKFEIIDTKGNIISSENTKNKVVFLNFWFTTCPPCIREIPELNKIYEKYKDNPDVVFASVCRDNKEKVNTFLKKHPLKLPISTISKSNIDLFNVDGFPTNIIIDKNGAYKNHVYMITESFGKYIEEALK